MVYSWQYRGRMTLQVIAKTSCFFRPRIYDPVAGENYFDKNASAFVLAGLWQYLGVNE
jgi:hypothetical protein